MDALLKVFVSLSFLTRLTNASPCRLRMLDRLLLSSYVPPHEWVLSLVNIVAPGLEGAREIIDRWNPFNKRESSVMHMRYLYPTFL